MADYQQRVAEKIIRAREQAGYDREPFALRAGISVKQMRRIEQGKSNPRLGTIRKIAETAGVKITDIRPDLDEEEQQIRAQLDRIERNAEKILEARLSRVETALESQLQLLLAIAERLGVEGAEPPLEQTERALDEILQWLERAASEREATPSEAQSRTAGDGSSRKQR